MKISFQQWPGETTGIVKTSHKGMWRQPRYTISEHTIDRDGATQFFNNPSMLKFGVQRVAVVDPTSGEVMICSPMRAAAYYILSEIRKDPNANVETTSVLTNVTQKELDQAMMYLRNRRNGTMTTNAEQNGGIPTTLTLREGAQDGSQGQQWDLTGFPESGGWATFFHQVMIEKNAWLAVIQGRTSNRVKDLPGMQFTLVFKDVEAELIFGEARRFTSREHAHEIVALQMRRGYAVIRGGHARGEEQEHADLRYDRLVMNDVWGRRKGVFGTANRLPEAGITWRIRPNSAVTDMELT